MAKFLCVCDGGNVRSHALAYVLHDRLGHEAIPVGRQRVTPDTLWTLCEWADVVVILQAHMEESIPVEFRHKLRYVDVGPDRFGVHVHPELLAMAEQGARWLTDNLVYPLEPAAADRGERGRRGVGRVGRGDRGDCHGLGLLVEFGRTLAQPECEPEVATELAMAVGEWYREYHDQFQLEEEFEPDEQPRESTGS